MNSHVERQREEIAKALSEILDRGKIRDWQAGWFSDGFGAGDTNATSGKRYRGSNAIATYLARIRNEYRDPRWVTFKQAKDLEGQIRKGEKGIRLLKFKEWDLLTKREPDWEKINSLPQDEQSTYIAENIRYMTNSFVVFNVEQCENLNLKTPETQTMSEEELAKNNDKIETVIRNSSAPILYDGGNNAYYSPASDDIHLPEIKRFRTKQDYYATAIHEIAHSTGHESRLNRNLSGGFGSADYAREELRAEISSLFVQSELGIEIKGKALENHAAYVNAWKKIAKEPNDLFDVIGDAKGIADYIKEHYSEKQRENKGEETMAKKEINEGFTTIIVNRAVQSVLREELSYVDALYTDPTSDRLFDENEKLKDIVKTGGQFDVQFALELLDKKKHIINENVLLQYGWDTEGLRRSIINQLPDEYKAQVRAADKPDYMEKTAEGFDVVSIFPSFAEKGKDDAIVSRETDGKTEYFIARNYDVTNGTWKQAQFGFNTLDDVIRILETEEFKNKGFKVVSVVHREDNGHDAIIHRRVEETDCYYIARDYDVTNGTWSHYHTAAYPTLDAAEKAYGTLFNSVNTAPITPSQLKEKQSADSKNTGEQTMAKKKEEKLQEVKQTADAAAKKSAAKPALVAEPKAPTQRTMNNAVALQGKLTAKPELKTAENGTAYAKVKIAVPNFYTTKETPVVHEIPVVLFNQHAEKICGFEKGDTVELAGRFANNKYDGKWALDIFGYNPEKTEEASKNVVTLTGFINNKKVELKTGANGTKYVTVALSVKDDFSKDEPKYDTYFVTAFNKSADIIAEKYKQRDLISITGAAQVDDKGISIIAYRSERIRAAEEIAVKKDEAQQDKSKTKKEPVNGK